jgi:hypothetical protein
MRRRVKVALLGQAILVPEGSTGRRLQSDFFLIESQSRRLSGRIALMFKVAMAVC